ncbi:MAG: ABC transporter ATP-binding protein [Candidatus Omnitrophica bacterium]|nr:ABC transporter ATP-binding protein [Candidatus Omnitrophota bacterium]
MNDYKRLSTFIKPHIWILALAIIFTLLAQSLHAISLGTLIVPIDRIVSDRDIALVENNYTPEFITRLVDKLNNTPADKLLVMLIIAIVAIFLLKGFFEFLHTYLVNMMSERIMKTIRNSLFEKMLSLSLDFYSNTSTGKLVSKITYDVTVLKNSLTQGLINVVTEPAKLLANILFMLFIKLNFNISWRWIIISVMLLPTVIYPVRVIGKRLKKIALKMQEKMGDINTVLYETISGIRIVKAFIMEKREAKRFADQNQNFYKITMKSIKRMLVVRPITEYVGVLCVALLLWFGKDELLSGEFSYGAFTALLFALLSLIKPMKSLSNLYGVVQQALAASSRIFEVLDAEPGIVEKPGAVILPEIKNDIVFEGVSFKYHTTEVLKKIDLVVKKGEILAIVGSSGVGKTTLVNLVPRFYDSTGGSIKIDGKDTRDVTLESLRKQIGIVTQDLILFNDTVKFNIAYGLGGENATDEDIMKAAKVANAHEFIVDLPKGYDTMIGEKGVRLSGGQKQRLAIARAMFKNPPILILDEATSQLDTESERLVQDALNRLMKGRTVFVIAHRLSTIKHATKIVTLEGGSIKESGTHKKLMEGETTYKRLYELQFRE